MTYARLETEEAMAIQAELGRCLNFIESRGYRRCDIPACNCGSWHGGHAQQRLQEINDALGNPNGVTTLKAVQQLVARNEELERREQMRFDGEVKGGCQYHPEARNQHCLDCLRMK